MSASLARSSWRSRGVTGGPSVRGTERRVRGSGPGTVLVDDDLVDEQAVTRGLEHQSRAGHLGLASLTLAERREVALRLCARFPDYGDAGAWIGTSAHVLRSYHHWALTGEWITPNRIAGVLRERAAAEGSGP